MAGDEVIVGRHVYGELYGIDLEAAGDEKLLVKAVKEAAALANMTLLDNKVVAAGRAKGRRVRDSAGC